MAYTTIDLPTDYFNTVTYTGNGVGGTNITGVGFQPDLVWIKRRSAVEYHVWNDAVRGVPKNIYSNVTNAEDTGSLMSAIISDGFTVQTDGSVNGSGSTYVAWNWLGANTTVSNTSGTITSTVSANTTSGFSIVSYTGNGSSGATVGHGIGSTVGMILLKGRSFSDNWAVYHKSIGGTGLLELNGTGGTNTISTRWNNTNAGATVFTLGNNSQVNNSGSTYVAYCFAEIKGYSKAFSYTGNGSSDGTFVYCGFRPAWILRKRTDSGGDWYIEDNKRNTYNPVDLILQPNLSSTEGTASSMSVDFLSNGFKVRGPSLDGNASSGTYIGIAFSENPFVSSGGIPTTAR